LSEPETLSDPEGYGDHGDYAEQAVECQCRGPQRALALKETPDAQDYDPKRPKINCLPTGEVPEMHPPEADVEKCEETVFS